MPWPAAATGPDAREDLIFQTAGSVLNLSCEAAPMQAE
jgi:hypothetical protein